MKQKMMEKDGVQTEVAENSVEAMEEAGWKVVGDAPDSRDPEIPSSVDLSGVRRLGMPNWLLTAGVLETVMAELPPLADAESRLTELKGMFGDLVTEDHAAYVMGLQVADPEEDGSSVDEKYDGMTKADIRELLDAKGVAYGEKDNKAKLVELLVASGKK